MWRPFSASTRLFRGPQVQADHRTTWHVQDTVLCRAVTALRRLPGHKLGRVSWRRVACRQDSDRQEERGRTGQGLEVGRRTTHSVTNQPAWTGLQAFSQGMTLKCSGHCQEVCASGGGGEAGATCQKAQSDHAYRQASIYRTKGKPSGGAGCRGFPSTVQTTRRIEPGKGPCPHPQVPPVSPSPPLRQEGLSHI